MEFLDIGRPDLITIRKVANGYVLSPDWSVEPGALVATNPTQILMAVSSWLEPAPAPVPPTPSQETAA